MKQLLKSNHPKLYIEIWNLVLKKMRDVYSEKWKKRDKTEERELPNQNTKRKRKL